MKTPRRFCLRGVGRVAGERVQPLTPGGVLGPCESSAVMTVHHRQYRCKPVPASRTAAAR